MDVLYYAVFGAIGLLILLAVIVLWCRFFSWLVNDSALAKAVKKLPNWAYFIFIAAVGIAIGLLWISPYISNM